MLSFRYRRLRLIRASKIISATCTIALFMLGLQSFVCSILLLNGLGNSSAKNTTFGVKKLKRFSYSRAYEP